MTQEPITLQPIGPGPRYDKVHIWLPQLIYEAAHAEQSLIEGRTFEGCRLEGPAVFLAVEGCDFEGCYFGDPNGDPGNLLLKPVGAERITGAIAFKNCRFIGCNFLGVGFTGTPEFVDSMLASLKGVQA